MTPPDDSSGRGDARSTRAARRGRIPRAARLARLATVLAAALIVAACGRISTSPPEPTPADFQGLAAEMSRRGIVLDRLVSGDAGCDDIELARTAIGLDASGLGQVEPVRIRLYIFRNRDAYERLRSDVDACARQWVTDPAGFESIEASPYVVAGQGPWAAAFRSALREAVTVAAGTGD